MKKPPRLKLKPFDLTLGEDHNHPHISGRKQYLALIGGVFHAGKFSKQWYGWNFDGWSYSGCGLQYDQPGTNSSNWQALWEIVKP